ncbi:hypothetical protein N7462_009104 [Penicillium macrosclerotiorum]|uniref:uncharacterized protein n=1 Tax=Penicillium macrosclerotiorum TaxID=303699 RepID=UPI002547F46A|nr:uncharacterized protein N7462_009104 [Penicillium macrosclerotiorum]KAJ5676207.1 hypothetical protein N7462_009104 [Penicillium macrosclerotiorum]
MPGAKKARADKKRSGAKGAKRKTDEEINSNQLLVLAGAAVAGKDDGPEVPELLRAWGVTLSRCLDQNLPPLYMLGDIFQDLSAKALSLGFANVLRHLGDRPLRVATVCSGTESPILALEMIQKDLGNGQRFRFSHAFSCEIVPFKQAYIERNFEPPILFRDLLELGGETARTAYGSSEVIPGNVDILIAGTACVDFSTLNNSKKELGTGGESTETFDALLCYADRYRPRLMVQENVYGAPWGVMAQRWEQIDYRTVYATMDTKDYYIPHTRMRGYMVCIDGRRLSANGLSTDDSITGITSHIEGLIDQFARRASSPAGQFLLADDDRRLEQISKDLATRIRAGAARAEVPWDLYQVRHQAFRDKVEVGNQRPISRSQGGGVVCRPPDFYWQDSFTAQVERVWETIDIKFLLYCSWGLDFCFKERWIDLSQGVDRGNEAPRTWGVTGCLTPMGMPFVTTRGGPVSGLEALALQGLPLDRIILTRESQRDLQDLAGNAMTTTPVAVAMLSALIAGYELLDSGAARPADVHPSVDDTTSFAVDEDHHLILVNVEVPPASLDQYQNLLQFAASSARHCLCERQSGVKVDIRQCALCGHRACGSCAGNPTHAYESPTKLLLRRSKPLEFIAYLKGILPMRLTLSSLSVRDFDEIPQSFPADDHYFDAATELYADTQREYMATVQAALSDEFRFFDIKRAESWTVIYEGEHASLHLNITKQSFQWLLFTKVSKHFPAVCLLREILAKPIARMTPETGSLLNGVWHVSAPISTEFPLWISGCGTEAKAYQNGIGLQNPIFTDDKVWTWLKIESSGHDKHIRNLDVDICGMYEFLPDCGTALGTLYRKRATVTSPAVYFFFDPRLVGEPLHDSYVFALEHSRLPGYTIRRTIAQLSHRWRVKMVTATPLKANAYYRAWTEVPNTILKPGTTDQIVYRSLNLEDQIRLEIKDCHHSYTSLVAMNAQAARLNLPQTQLPWQAENLGKSSTEFKKLAWAIQRISAWAAFEDWKRIAFPFPLPFKNSAICQVCHPQVPGIIWGRNKKNIVVPYEDPKGAATYERASKLKPPPFILLRKVDEAGDAELRFALNIQSLAHRAFGKLPETGSNVDTRFYWRLLSNAYDLGRTSLPRFTLLSNQHETPHIQPPNFRHALRLEQLRSLTWLIAQEADNILPFIEEEIEEAELPLMTWRAEVKATKPQTIRGGLIADEVGYGKTAIVLGLIDAQYQHDTEISKTLPEQQGQIATNASLIVVPGNVFSQWKDEIVKFLGETKYTVLAISGASAMKKIHVKQFQQADIVLVSLSLFRSPTYYKAMQYFTGAPRLPNKPGRCFDNWFQDALQSLREQIDILKRRGPEYFLQNVRARRAELKRTQANSTYVPSRRLRGAALAAAREKTDEDIGIGELHPEVPSMSPEFRRTSVEQTPDGTGLSPSPETFKKYRAVSVLTDPTTVDSVHFSDEFPGSDASENEGSTDESEDERTNSDDHNSNLRQYDDFNPGDENAERGTGKQKAQIGADGKDDTDTGDDNWKRKRGKQPARKPPQNKWNDRKAFNIPKYDAFPPKWENMKYPMLHAFRFNRIVIDEYTYQNQLASDRTISLLSISARSRWILSGTPALDDFADAKTIAQHLKVHLGIDEDGDVPSGNLRLKKARSNLTAMEAFQLYQPPRSASWYQNRHTHAQSFLDRFARQNFADTSQLPVEFHLVLSNLSNSERDLYNALYQRIVQDKGRVRKIIKDGKDLQVSQLNDFLTKSQSPEEALLKCCTSTAISDFAWSLDKCQKHLKTHNVMLKDRHDKLIFLVKQVVDVVCRSKVEEANWETFTDTVFEKGFGDAAFEEDTRQAMNNILGQHGQHVDEEADELIFQKVANRFLKIKVPKSALKVRKNNAPAANDQPESGAHDAGDDDESQPRKRLRDFQGESPEERAYKETAVIKALIKELNASINAKLEVVRGIRFYAAMQDLQTKTDHSCDNCRMKTPDLHSITVIRSCGHALCSGCIENPPRTKPARWRGAKDPPLLPSESMAVS